MVRGRTRTAEPETLEDNGLNLKALKEKKISDLALIGKNFNIEGAANMRKQELIFAILQAQTEQNGHIYGEGVLETLPDGFGFLRAPDYNYLPGPDDIYVSPSQIRRFNLRTGDVVVSAIFAHLKKASVISHSSKSKRSTTRSRRKRGRKSFSITLRPCTRRRVEVGTSPEDYTARIIDLVDADREGATWSRGRGPAHRENYDVAKHCARHSPEPQRSYSHRLAYRRTAGRSDGYAASVGAEVVSSTFDEPATRHVQVAEMVIEKAKRLVEHGRDVVILLDSITRLARAYNTVVPPSGKLLSGGVDSNALHEPKKFFGAASNIEDGGSLTIIATALIDTGSRMDEVIFEEFKGTGNMEVHLDRRLMDKRVFPAIDINKSGTRKEELLIAKEDLNRIWILRKVLSQLSVVDAMEFLQDKLHGTKNNKEFLESMNQ